jgi:hypothetical protein
MTDTIDANLLNVAVELIPELGDFVEKRPPIDKRFSENA